jgi:AbrB family looped-hinge helix DNA binding protein
MPTHVTSKGQVTVPKSIRDYLGLKAGSAVIFERTAGGDVVLKPAGKTSRPRHGTHDHRGDPRADARPLVT